MPPSQDGLCTKCLEIGVAQVLQGQEGPRKTEKMGSLEEVRRRQRCPFCRLVLRLFSQDGRSHDWRLGDVSKPAKDQFEVMRLQGSRGFIVHYDILERGSIRIQDNERPVADEYCEAKLNYSLYRKWVRDCRHRHGSECEERKSTERALDLLLIDVNELRLTRAKSSVRYVCLSYVWGGCSTLQVTQATLSRYQQKRGLQPYLHLLPQTVRDAITFVAQFGEKYLWVDSLCIVQDDPYKQEQINKMDIVYGYAFLTIVALAGKDANAGLPGVRLGSRLSLRAVATVPGCGVIETRPKRANSAILESCYVSRAWTFQEQIMSCRILYFFNQQVFFQCEREIRQEIDGESFGMLVERGNGKDFLNPLTLFLREFAQDDSTPLYDAWGTYRVMVRSYAERQMTSPADIINAFAGCSSVMERYFQCKFIWGLPDILFDAMLLWYPRSGDLKRRVVKDHQLPSWSWVGWSGGIEFLQPGPRSDLALDTRSVYKETGCFYANWNQSCHKIEPCYATPRILEKGMNESRWQLLYCHLLNYKEEMPNATRTLTQPNDSGFQMNNILKEDLSIPLLQFRAAALEVSRFMLEVVDKYKSHSLLGYTKVLDDRQRHCGSILQDNLSLSGSRLREFVVLSRSTSATLEKDTGWYIPFYDTTHFREYWGCKLDLVIVLLIEWSGAFAERLGIGAIHDTAWPSELATLKDIRLI